VLITFLEAIFEILFSSSVAFLIMSVASQKSRPFSADFSLGTGKMSWIYVRSLGGCFIVVILFFAKKSVTKNRLVLWSIAVKEKPAVGSSFFGAFPSYRPLKATKEGSQGQTKRAVVL
jgi:hypothetical protein